MSISASSIITLSNKKINFIFTTHLHELSLMKKITELNNLKVYHIGVTYTDNNDIIFNRQLQDGNGGTLYGIEVANSIINIPDFIKLSKDIRRDILGIASDILPSKKSQYNNDLYLSLCSICNAPAVDTHHIQFQNKADNNGFITHYNKDNLHNLVQLCKKCHNNLHSGKLLINGYINSLNKGLILDWKNLD
jgi:DNA mismatch repair protein MutS